MQIGQKISHFVVEEKLGDGGFGEVFRARDAVSSMEVAIKCLKASAMTQSPDMAQRFMREISCIAKLRHPGIVQLFDYGSEPDGSLYFIMEYLRGHSLERILREKKFFDFKTASDIVLQILDALSEAHAQGIVHRDLKPANLMLVQQGLRSGIVKILDFGIAKAFDGSDSDLTAKNVKAISYGTPQYMPPEQFFGKKPGPHSDLYSVGLIFYELLTGKQACGGKTISEIIEKQFRGTPDIPAPLNEGPLARIFKRSLAKQISERYASAAEMYADIEAMTRYRSAFLDKYLAFRPNTIAVSPFAVQKNSQFTPADDEASTVDDKALSMSSLPPITDGSQSFDENEDKTTESGILPELNSIDQATISCKMAELKTTPPVVVEVKRDTNDAKGRQMQIKTSQINASGAGTNTTPLSENDENPYVSGRSILFHMQNNDDVGNDQGSRWSKLCHAIETSKPGLSYFNSRFYRTYRSLRDCTIKQLEKLITDHFIALMIIVCTLIILITVILLIALL